MYIYRNHMQYNTWCFSAQNIIHRYDLALINDIILISGDIFLSFFFFCRCGWCGRKNRKTPHRLVCRNGKMCNYMVWPCRPTMGRNTLQACA